MDTYGKGKLKPTDSKDKLAFTYWLHFAEGSAMQPVILTLLFTAVPAKSPFFIRPIANGIANAVLGGFVKPNLKKQLTFMNGELEKQQWFAGPEFSAADIIMR